MEIKSESTETLKWEMDFMECHALITGTNNSWSMTHFRFSKNKDNGETAIFEEDELRNVHKAMGDLIQHLDKKRGVGNVLPSQVNGEVNKNTDPFWVKEMIE